MKKVFLLLILVLSIIQIAEAQSKRKQKKINEVIAIGKSYIGTPYRYGGVNKSGIDCSSLIQNSYKAIGINLPRTAKEQSKIGTKRGWNGIRPGDIVYFKFKEKGSRWYHSGMITSVSEYSIKFIHASTSSGVVESELYSDYYRKNVKSFRRVIR